MKEYYTVRTESGNRAFLLSYFPNQVGQDPLISITDNWGPEDPAPLNLEKLPMERLPRVSFLFGGIGDGT